MSTEIGSEPVLPAATSVAERMRLYRRRQSRGLRCVRVLIGPAELEGLVAQGYLPTDKRDDAEAISLAIDDFMFDRLIET